MNGGVKRKSDLLQAEDEPCFGEACKSFKKHRAFQVPWRTAPSSMGGDVDMTGGEQSPGVWMNDDGDLDKVMELPMQEDLRVTPPDSTLALVPYREPSVPHIPIQSNPYDSWPSPNHARVPTLSFSNFHAPAQSHGGMPFPGFMPSGPSDDSPVKDPTLPGASRRLNSCYYFAGTRPFPVPAFGPGGPPPHVERGAAARSDEDDFMVEVPDEREAESDQGLAWAIVPWCPTPPTAGPPPPAGEGLLPSGARNVPGTTLSCAHTAFLKDNSPPMFHASY